MLLGILWDFAMWSEAVPVQRNPIELVTVKGASKRTRQPRSLTVEQFQKFVARLDEPFRVVALTCVCLGLRISECLALRWSDVDWLHGRLRVERGIVRQCVDEVKTAESRKDVTLDAELLTVLRLPGSKRPNSLSLGIGFLPALLSMADCRGLTLKCGACFRMPRQTQG